MQIDSKLTFGTRIQVQVKSPDGTVHEGDWIDNTVTDFGLGQPLGLHPSHKYSSMLDFVRVGTDNTPTDYAQTNLNAPVGNLNERTRQPMYAEEDMGVRSFIQPMAHSTSQVTFTADIAEVGLFLSLSGNTMTNRIVLDEPVAVRAGDTLTINVEAIFTIPVLTTGTVNRVDATGAVLGTTDYAMECLLTPQSLEYRTNQGEPNFLLLKAFEFINPEVTYTDDTGQLNTFYPSSLMTHQSDASASTVGFLCPFKYEEPVGSYSQLKFQISYLFHVNADWVLTFDPPISKEALMQVTVNPKFHIQR